MYARTLLFIQCVLCGVVTTQANTDIPQNVTISNIWLNGIDRNTETLLLEENQSKYVECAVLEKLQILIAKLQKNPAQAQYCLVTDGKVNAEVDLALQSIKIDLPADYFVGSDFAQDKSMPDPAHFGAFLNYEMFYGKDNDTHSFSTLAELGVFKDYWLFKNAMVYRDSAEDQKVVRLSTVLDIDFPERYTRLTVGDTTTVWSPLMNSFRFGGVTYGTNFTEHPDFIYWNMPTLKGSALLPSTVDLYINGVNIYQQSVTPGHYALQSGANIQQAGEAQIVVEDVLGNRTVQKFPVYINSRLLKPDLNEYSFSLGKIRYDYEYSDDDYREFFSSAYFRRGISDQTTLGFNASYSKDLQNFGLLWTQGISRFALLDLSVSGSRTSLDEGYSIGASLTRSVGNLSMGVSSKYSNPTYKSLGYSDFIETTKFDNLAYLSLYNVPYLNNVNFNYVERRYHENPQFSFPDTKILNLGFTRMIGKKISFSASYFKEFQDDGNEGAFFSFSYYFDNNRSVYADHSTDNESRLRWVKNSPVQNGIDYSLGVNQKDGDVSYNSYAMFKSTYGDLGVSYDRSAENFYNAQVTYRGALTLLGGHTAMTKYVDNAFALVKVGDYADVDVFRSLSPVATTLKDGSVFVHNIVPYISYDLSFDQDQIPIEDKIEYADKKLVALNQRGYVINFPIYKTKLMVVKLFTPDHKTLSRASEVYIDDNRQEFSPVDADGKVYLYGLRPSKYRLFVKTSGERTCNAQLDIPQERLEEMASKVIELVCE
ncbi:fimbria/pilus outer membrane usher protein [Acinetobacter piscicola]|uniref:fimbria/pilus outer membrane usher protein n=1 Tax=Acinetobacter piscicola TaxID=2006115 RepID=UPI000B7E5884|nr:fimbria/pilus outer membrane usher protein [Acinetobacter piscicola]